MTRTALHRAESCAFLEILIAQEFLSALFTDTIVLQSPSRDFAYYGVSALYRAKSLLFSV